jgi:hypothetical protein
LLKNILFRRNVFQKTYEILKAGNPYCRGRFSTVNLLVKVACLKCILFRKNVFKKLTKYLRQGTQTEGEGSVQLASLLW